MEARDEKIKGRDFLLVLGGMLLMADAFGLDLALPLEMAVGVPYALVVIPGLWWPGRGFIYTAAILATLACLLGFYFTLNTGFSSEEHMQKAILDRALAIVTIGMVAALCLYQKRTQRKNRELKQLIQQTGGLFSGEMAPSEQNFLFKKILDSVGLFTASRIGIACEVLENPEGELVFQKRSGVAWDSVPKKPKASAPGEAFPSALEYYHIDPMLNEVLHSGLPLIMKYVSPAVTKTPLPVGQHLMESFMGLPLIHAGKLLGIVAVANREGGYDDSWAEYLIPFLAACSANIHLLRMDEEKHVAEHALGDHDLKMQELEKSTGALQSVIDEKNDRLTGIEAQLEVVETTLRDKEALITGAEEERSRSKEALQEKEDRLTTLTKEFHRLENDLEEERQKGVRLEKKLQQVQDQLNAKDPQKEEMESRILHARNPAPEKERFAPRFDEDIYREKIDSEERDRWLGQKEPEESDMKRELREYEKRLSRVETELEIKKKTLSSPEGLLEKIGRKIQDALVTKGEAPFLAEPPKKLVYEGLQDPGEFKTASPEELKNGDGASYHATDFISYDEAGQGICGLDLNGSTTFINPEGARMLGYDSTELVGKNQHMTMHHSRIDATPYRPEECYICNTLSDGVVSHVVDEVFWKKDGSSFPVEYLSTPIYKDNKQVGAVVTFTDTSQRNPNEESRAAFRLDFDPKPKTDKRMKGSVSEDQPENGERNPEEKASPSFRQYSEAMERSNRDLKEFASIASHDLQEPLRKIIGFGTRLKKDYAPSLDARGLDYLDRMERSAHQMQSFINDLLQYSKLNVPIAALGQRVNLRDVIASVLGVLESRLDETRAHLDVGPMPVIEADRVQMQQLFQNLISNALKFHKAGEAPEIRISHRFLENGWHEIRVEDQGIGIEEEHLERIFKPFERLHGKMEYEGTGMGLAICQKIVQRHGGEISAKSSPHQGATFIITLPER